MSDRAWRYIYTSVIGTSHLKVGQSCQDACGCRLQRSPPQAAGEDILFAIASDGAGSASRAEIGSRLVCSDFENEISGFLENGGRVRDLTPDFFFNWVQRYQCRIAALAESEGLAERDYACTALAAVVGEDESAFFQVGDGAIVISSIEEPEEHSWVFWPQKGEFANETAFLINITAMEQIEYESVARSVEEIAIFTDGLERLVLNFPQQIVHAPFFRKAFAPLRAAKAGHVKELSDSLAVFLSSPEVNARTDDDKTLILATRRKIG